MQHPPYQNQYHQPYYTQWAGTPITPQPPVPPPLPKAQKGHKALISLIIAALLLLLPLFGYLYAPQIMSALISIEPSCTVGVTGTAAAITFQGWNSTNDCTALVSENQGSQK